MSITTDHLGISILLLQAGKYRAEEYCLNLGKQSALTQDNQACLSTATFSIDRAIEKLKELRQALQQ